MYYANSAVKRYTKLISDYNTSAIQTLAELPIDGQSFIHPAYSFAFLKGVSHAFKVWGDLRLRGQSFDRKFLLQHCIDQALASFIAKILLDPWPIRLKTSKKSCSLTVDIRKYFELTVDFQFDRGRRSTHSVRIIMSLFPSIIMLHSIH